MTSKPPSPLDKLLEKRAQLDARIQTTKARLRQQERKADTRRKIIVGALAIEHADIGHDPEFSATLYRLLNRYVTRPGDRTLLDLPPRDDQANTDEPPADIPKKAAGK